MRYLPDTHLLLWAIESTFPLPKAAQDAFEDTANEIFFSAVSIWEVAFKSARGHSDFQLVPRTLRDALLAHGYTELAVTAEHACAVYGLPTVHKDPFDRLLIAQAIIEDIPLLTANRTLARYPAPVQII